MLDTHTWDDRHYLMAAAHDADQTEKIAMVRSTAPIDSGVADEGIAGVISETEVSSSGDDEWAIEDQQAEGFAGALVEEIKRRQDLLGEGYPFKLEGNALHYVGSSTGVYEFCLAVSLANKLAGKPWRDLPLWFELLSAHLAKLYINPLARVVRTGWPSHDSAERPIRFKALSQLLSEQCNEWKWSPQEPNPDDPTPRQVKDAGVDYVVWMPFADKRPGQLFLLGQCACGKDWDSKLDELSSKNLDQWLRPPTYADFQRSFAIPRHLPGWHIFGRVAKQAGIPFDRARLSEIAENPANSKDVAQKFKKTLNELTKLVIPDWMQPN